MVFLDLQSNFSETSPFFIWLEFLYFATFFKCLQYLWCITLMYIHCNYFVMSFFNIFSSSMGNPLKTILLCPAHGACQVQDSGFFHNEMGQYRRYSSPSFQFLCSFRLPSLKVIHPKCYNSTYSWNIKWQKCARMGLNGFIFKKINEN